jgi:hypothetical protein
LLKTFQELNFRGNECQPRYEEMISVIRQDVFHKNIGFERGPRHFEEKVG